MYAFSGGINGNIPQLIGAGPIAPFYVGMKAVLFAVGSQQQLHDALQWIGLAGSQPNSPPGGVLWSWRGVYAGLAGDISGIRPTEPMLPVPDPKNRLRNNFLFPVGVKGTGIATPLFVDPAFNTHVRWMLKEGSSTRFKSLTVPEGSIPPGASLDLILNGAAYPLAEGVAFDFADDAEVSDVKEFVIRATDPAANSQARYVLGLVFTKPSPLTWLKQLELTPFTDEQLISGVTTIKAMHIVELRQRIDAARSRAGLAAYPWTDPSLLPGQSIIRAQHFLELRSGLVEAYMAAGKVAPNFSALLTIGVPISGAAIGELRAAVIALEGID